MLPVVYSSAGRGVQGGVEVNDSPVQCLHDVNVSGRPSLWCVRPCQELKEPSAGERCTQHTLRHILTGHYLFIWLKWVAVGMVFRI